MTQPQSQTNKQTRTFVFLLVMLALGLRVLHTPIHLAQEGHLGAGSHVLMHVGGGDGHTNVGHDDHSQHEDHEHDEGHAPHSEFDHANDLIAQRTAGQEMASVLFVSLQDEDWSFSVAEVSLPAPETESRPPKQGPRRATRPPGPPAAA